MTKREMAIKMAWLHVGTPYVWGGDDPMRGFDCSGLIVEILKSVGKLPRGTDYTAKGLFNLYATTNLVPLNLTYLPGTLLFWGKSSIYHVAMVIEKGYTISASGGGSHILDLADAIAQNAYVKIRPITNPHYAVDPFYE